MVILYGLTMNKQYGKTRSYRRWYVNGGCYFFTVVTEFRRPILTRPNEILVLRDAFRHVMQQYPFKIDAIVILPDHLHAIWTMPNDSSNFSIRWRLIKAYFTKNCDPSLRVSTGRRSKISKGEQEIWQRRFWEHQIKSENELQNIIRYIHNNPVKHGYVSDPRDWPYSSYS